MASVRLTATLRDEILKNIDEKYSKVLESYQFPKSVLLGASEMVAAKGVENIKLCATVTKQVYDILAAVMPESALETMYQRMMYSTTDHRSPTYVDVDVVSSGGDKLFSLTAPLPPGRYFDYFLNNRHSVILSPEEEEEAVSIAKLKAETNAEFKAIRTAATAVFNSCTTLNQLLKKWPDLKPLVPQTYIDQYEGKSSASKRKTPITELDVDLSELSTKLRVATVTASML
jgi:hypothetical protein